MRRKGLRCASDYGTLAQTEHLLFVALTIRRTQGSISGYINIRTWASFCSLPILAHLKLGLYFSSLITFVYRNLARKDIPCNSI